MGVSTCHAVADVEELGLDLSEPLDKLAIRSLSASIRNLSAFSLGALSIPTRLGLLYLGLSLVLLYCSCSTSDSKPLSTESAPRDGGRTI